jgi:hypothetical protein
MWCTSSLAIHTTFFIHEFIDCAFISVSPLNAPFFELIDFTMASTAARRSVRKAAAAVTAASPTSPGAVTSASVADVGIGQKRVTSNPSAVTGATSQGAAAKAGGGGEKKAATTSPSAGAGGGEKGTTSNPSGGKKGTTSIPSTVEVATPECMSASTSLGKARHGKKGTTSSRSTVEMANDQPTKKRKLSVNKTKKKLTGSIAKAVGGKKGAVSNIAINNYLFYEFI